MKLPDLEHKAAGVLAGCGLNLVGQEEIVGKLVPAWQTAQLSGGLPARNVETALRSSRAQRTNTRCLRSPRQSA